MTAQRTKFYLDKQNAKWSGVCSGIADYTGVEAMWIRIGAVLLTLAGGFPWTLIAYGMIAWMAPKKPVGLYDSEEDAKFWQGVRSNPKRSTAEIRSTFRDIDRRLADIEMFYTSRNTRLADEIDSLR
ncbi:MULTISPECIES: envelope stress response membrane protein PspC [Sphingomonas]|uniref:envelope stress response membrane protein PspC n=1 Tax=Sphingomonas TaxID=13687 RepID=UPI000F7EF949|nr:MULTISPECIES: envelope stress response membrane protein PspC [unclassified Sphingomonas]MCG7347384.1 envelope stress response membrane protein PspC [Sphingomonas sp. ACRSK]RSV16640.1 envelope stress response membrane protein PspC [Sphingomonas sp. ABOLF]GLK19415.1 phage-shock protein [Microbacterium terregens]